MTDLVELTRSLAPSWVTFFRQIDLDERLEQARLDDLVELVQSTNAPDPPIRFRIHHFNTQSHKHIKPHLPINCPSITQSGSLNFAISITLRSGCDNVKYWKTPTIMSPRTTFPAS
jgi:hypothetical protein